MGNAIIISSATGAIAAPRGTDLRYVLILFESSSDITVSSSSSYTFRLVPKGSLLSLRRNFSGSPRTCSAKVSESPSESAPSAKVSKVGSQVTDI